MGDPLDSILVEYKGSTPSGTDTGKLLNDDARNRIEQGITDESISPSPVSGYDYHILCQLPPGYVIDKLTTTDSQAVNNGLEVNNMTEERVFFPNTEDKNLNVRSTSSVVTASFYGRETTFTVTDYLKIKATASPVIADITYPYEAYSITIKKTDFVDWPIGLVITAVEA